MIITKKNMLNICWSGNVFKVTVTAKIFFLPTYIAALKNNRIFYMVRIIVTINTMNVSKRSHRMTNNFHKCPTTRNKTPLYNLSDHTHYIFGGVKNNFKYTEHLMTILRAKELQILFCTRTSISLFIVSLSIIS